MLPYLSRLIGHVRVTEEKGLVKISGIDAVAFTRDIDSKWKTTRFTKNAISSSGGSWIAFRLFYAIEFLFIIDELIKTRSNRTPKRSLYAMREELVKIAMLRRIVEKERLPDILDLSRLNDFTKELFSYQRGFVELFNELVPRYGLKGYILGDKPGAGKTITAIATAHASGTKTKIIIAPMNSINNVWEATLSTIFKTPTTLYTTLSATNNKLVPGLEYYVFHYEALEQANEFVENNRKELGDVFLIVDESHNFNETVRKFSKRTQALLDLGQHSTYTLPMSGTVFRALGNEIIPIFMLLDPLFDASTAERFRGIYGASANRAKDILAHRIGMLVRIVETPIAKPTLLDYSAVVKDGKDFTLATISEQMRTYITTQMAYYTKHEKQSTKTYFDLIEVARVKGRLSDDKLRPYLRLTREFHEGYDPILHKGKPAEANQFEEAYILPYLNPTERNTFKDVRSIYKYMWLKVQGEALGKVLGRARARAATAVITHEGEFVNAIDKSDTLTLSEMIDGSPSKTVIFASYVETVKAAADTLRARGYSPVVIYGDNSKELTPLLKVFETDPRANPLITTFQTLSTATPLVMASTTILANQPFRDMIREQTLARTARIGQPHPTKAYDLTMDTGGEPNITTRNRDIIEWSRTEVEAIMSRTRVQLIKEGYGSELIPVALPGGSSELLDLVIEESGLIELDTPVEETLALESIANDLLNVLEW